jgi:hypothetical protein
MSNIDLPRLNRVCAAWSVGTSPLAICERENIPLSVLISDLTYAKNTNDPRVVDMGVKRKSHQQFILDCLLAANDEGVHVAVIRDLIWPSKHVCPSTWRNAIQVHFTALRNQGHDIKMTNGVARITVTENSEILP